ncbi:hypothetical protein BZL30_1095 [Mycobacterium kansasii]|uniref:Uncharacterized protein n=1 Tax=Mycobacterium kansasii TaxID=1768 RepID=A0A1V3XTC8_MYCKA|nr:hypothetical protein BZL30_1095 [Mycobacterium kansasii]
MPGHRYYAQPVPDTRYVDFHGAPGTRQLLAVVARRAPWIRRGVSRIASPTGRRSSRT